MRNARQSSHALSKMPQMRARRNSALPSANNWQSWRAPDFGHVCKPGLPKSFKRTSNHIEINQYIAGELHISCRMQAAWWVGSPCAVNAGTV